MPITERRPSNPGRDRAASCHSSQPISAKPRAAAAVARREAAAPRSTCSSTMPASSRLPRSRRRWPTGAKLRRVMQVNLTAPAELCKLAVAHFRKQGGGKIVNIASRAAHRGDAPDQWPYAASKGALVALTKTIARGLCGGEHSGLRRRAGLHRDRDGLCRHDGIGYPRIVSEIPLGSMARPRKWAPCRLPLYRPGAPHDRCHFRHQRRELCPLGLQMRQRRSASLHLILMQFSGVQARWPGMERHAGERGELGEGHHRISARAND